MSLESLSNNQKINKIKIYGKIRNYTQNFFHENDFIEIGPLMLGKSVDPLGPDPGSSIVGIPSIEYDGQNEISRSDISLYFLRAAFISFFSVSVTSR